MVSDKKNLFSSRTIKNKATVTPVQYDFRKVVNNVIFGIKDYTPVSRRTLEKYGDKIIRKLILGRYPIESQKQVEGLLRGKFILENGIFDEKSWIANGNDLLEQEIGHDRLWHLYSLVELEDVDDEIIVEKQTTVRIEPNKGEINKDAIAAQRQGGIHETMNVDLGGKKFTLIQMMNRTQQRMGGRFFSYNSFDNNCQDFLDNMLKAMKINSVESSRFINQDLGKLQEELPWFSKFIGDLGTEIEARFVSVMEGGQKINYKNEILNDNIRMDKLTADEVKLLKVLLAKIEGKDKPKTGMIGGGNNYSHFPDQGWTQGEKDAGEAARYK